MKKIRLILAAAAALTYGAASACTNFIVTRGASTDGSVMVTYAADSHALYGALYHTLGGKHNLADVLHLLRVEQRIELGIVADQYTQRDSFRSRARFSRTSS